MLRVVGGSGLHLYNKSFVDELNYPKKHQSNIMRITIITICSLISSAISFAQSLDKALLLAEQGLTSEAKIELIDVIFSRSPDNDKAKAYYELGKVAFENTQISQALKSWTKLTENYPNSKEAKLVEDELDQLSEIVGESAKETVDNAVAASYLRHADFWSSDRQRVFTIDSSWIPKVKTAIKWYDKIIEEFPNTKAARIAYEEKLRTLIGWEDRGQYGSSYGLKSSFRTYMPQLLSTFEELETNFPNAPTLQAFRYQIAQSYWNEKDFGNTRVWLNEIIKQAGDVDSFYKDTAERRLQKVEY